MAEKKISEESHYYPDFLSIECAENMHIHLRNIRLQFLLSDWEVFSQAMIKAYKEWCSMGKPYPWQGTEALYLYPAWSSYPSKQFDANRMAIELQHENPNNLPEIHVHYKGLRIDLNRDELREWISLFKQAERSLNEE